MVKGYQCHTRIWPEAANFAPARQRKTEQALHLLRESELDIKSIAIECGLPDMQQFNKLVRGATGVSPRACRQSIFNGNR